MNVPKERGEQSYVDVQQLIFQRIEERTGRPHDLATIIALSAPFRDWAKHLGENNPEREKELVEAWKVAEESARRLEELRASIDKLRAEEAVVLTKLEGSFEVFHNDLKRFIESTIAQSDPETVSELTAALEEDNVDRAREIFDRCLELKRRNTERVEE